MIKNDYNIIFLIIIVFWIESYWGGILNSFWFYYLLKILWNLENINFKYELSWWWKRKRKKKEFYVKNLIIYEIIKYFYCRLLVLFL